MSLSQSPRSGTHHRSLILRALVCLGALTSSWNAVRIGPLNLVDYVLIAALAFALVQIAIRRLTVKLHLWMFIPSVAIGLLVVRDVLVFGRPLNQSAELLSSGSGASPLLIFVRIVLATLVVSVLVATLSAIDGATAMLPILKWWIFGILVSSVVAVLQDNSVPLAFLNLVQTTSLYRFPGLTSHPNSLAQSASLALPVAIYFFATSRGASRFIQLIPVCIFVVALYAAGSRAGLGIGLAAAVVGAVWYLSRSRFMVVLAPTLLVAIAATLMFGGLIFAGTRLSSGAADSDAGRAIALQRGFDLFLQSPLWGVGVGSWIGEAVPLIILTTGGLLLLPAYYAFFLPPLLTFWRLRAADPLYIALITSSISLVIFGFLNNGFAERYIFWPIVVGAVLAPHVLSLAGTRTARSLTALAEPRNTKNAIPRAARLSD
jgi:hypothetical protein